MTQGPAATLEAPRKRRDRLTPDQLLPGLETRWLARELVYHERADSTNRIAQTLGWSGAAHGTTVIAEAQTAGRGRLGRSFFSPPFQNLYTSIVLRPRLDPRDAPTLVLAAAVAVAEAVAETLGDAGPLEIKWPNDVLLGGLKTSGILMELHTRPGHSSFAVLGIGVNLNVERDQFPQEFRERATSLRSHSGEPVDRVLFTRLLFGILEQVMDTHAERGFTALRPRFEARFHMRGRRVRVLEPGNQALCGIVKGIDASGNLRIERDTGDIVSVLAGDVSLEKPGVGH